MLPQFEVRGKGQSKIAFGRVNEPCGTFSRSEVALKIKKAGKWLDAGVIGGAAIEVMCAEPPDVKSRLPQHPRCIVTPHVAAFSCAFEKNFFECSVGKLLKICIDLNRVAGVEPATFCTPIANQCFWGDCSKRFENIATPCNRITWET